MRSGRANAFAVSAEEEERFGRHAEGHSGAGASLREIARSEKVESSYFTRIIRLTFLSPEIAKAILDGRQPSELTASRLMRDTRFPLDWKKQRDALGFT